MDGLMLIVDDAEVNREILRVLFEPTYDVMTAENAEQALAILEGCRGSVDIVLLDLQMPGVTGFELLERRAELECFKGVPVVVITGSSAPEDQVCAFELGASDYIQKPFVPEIVVSRVANVMASSRRLESIELEAQKLRIKSETDEMTGLLNKSTTEVLIQERLKKSAGQLDALLMIDIDNFKTVNDSSGHQAGDGVIKVIANLISSRFRKTDYVGRIGGDEFCVLMVDVPSMKIVHQKVNELIQVMRYKPNLAIPDYVTLSIGVATNEERATSYAELFKRADSALYQAKAAGRARYQEFGMDMTSAADGGCPAVLLLSDSRSVCSAVHALLPPQIRILEVLRFEDLDRLSEEERARVALMYADVSDRGDDAESCWQQLESLPWIRMEQVFAICQEGSVSQYMAALKHNVLDLFTAPIEADTFKRRTNRQLEKLGLLREDD